MKTYILQQNDIAILHLVDHTLDVGADTVRGHLDGFAEILGEAGGYRSKAELRLRAVLGAAKMGCQYQTPAVVDDVSNGRHGCLDAGIVCDMVGLIEWHVEINPAEDPFAMKVNIPDGELF
jgi:hypothetical protein